MRYFVFILLFFILIGTGFGALTPAKISPGKASFGFDVIPSLTINSEYGISRKIGVGASIGIFNDNNQVFIGNRSTYFAAGETSYLETHIGYFVHNRDAEVPIDISLLGGLMFTESKLSLEAGVLLGVPLSREFTTRFNLIVGPRAGFELAYNVSPELEACLDLAVAAGVLGFRIYF